MTSRGSGVCGGVGAGGFEAGDCFFVVVFDGEVQGCLVEGGGLVAGVWGRVGACWKSGCNFAVWR